MWVAPGGGGEAGDDLVDAVVALDDEAGLPEHVEVVGGHVRGFPDAAGKFTDWGGLTLGKFQNELPTSGIRQSAGK